MPSKHPSVITSVTTVTPAIDTKKRSKVKFVYAARVPAYEKPHRGTGVELYQHVALADGNSSNTGLSSVAALAAGSNMQLQLAGKNVEQTSASSSVSVAGLSSNDATADGTGPRSGRTRSSLNTSFPVGLPLSQGALPAALKRREKDIYACSDSEDELIDYPRSKRLKAVDAKSEGWRDLTSKYYLTV